jgi:hypothetical protein
MAATPALNEYYEALARLIANRPKRVAKGIKISNDSVAIEAGRCKGSIKKSRPGFLELIKAIHTARERQVNGSADEQQKAQIAKIKGLTKRYRDELDIAIGSLVSYVYQIHQLQQKTELLESQVNELTAQLAAQAKVKSFRPIGA